MIMELSAIYDSRKSFYGKATVNEEQGIYNMFSYGVKYVNMMRTQENFTCLQGFYIHKQLADI